MDFFGGKKKGQTDAPKAKEAPNLTKLKMEAENKKLDELAEPELHKQIIDLIETNLNRKYFKESKLDPFFTKCFELQNPKQFKEKNQRFYRFLYDDLKFILQKTQVPENFEEFTKLITFFGADDDPELFDLLADGISRAIGEMEVETILNCLVNFAHTLNPNAEAIFRSANQEFLQRLNFEYSATNPKLYVQADDLLKICNVLLDHRQMEAELIGEIFSTIVDKQNDFNYDQRSEFAVVFASKMDARHKDKFFDAFLDKFSADLQYLSDDIIYKILWSSISAGRFTNAKDFGDWLRVRDVLIDKASSMDTSVLTKLLVLSTKVTEYESKAKADSGSDLWDALEPSLIPRLAEMAVEDLVDLMWSAI